MKVTPSSLSLWIIISITLTTFACSTPPRANWVEKFEGDGSIFRYTTGSYVEGSLEESESRLETIATRKALERAVEQIVVDMAPGSEPDRETTVSRISSRLDRYLLKSRKQASKVLGDELAVQVTVEIEVDRGALLDRLAELGVISNQRLRTILVLRDKVATDNPIIPATQEHLDDLAENMSGELYSRGFEPKLWRDEKLRLATSLDAGDPDMEALIVNFVDESEWRQATDERYVIPMVLLRTLGRMMVGMSIQELEKRGLELHAAMRVDVYDLLNRRSLGSSTFSDRREIGTDTLLAASNALIASVAAEAIEWGALRMQEVQILEGRRTRTEYELRFRGYSPAELNRIEEYMVAILQEDAESENDGTDLLMRAKIQRDPVPLRKEIELILRHIGAPAGPAQRSGTKILFTKGN